MRIITINNGYFTKIIKVTFQILKSLTDQEKIFATELSSFLKFQFLKQQVEKEYKYIECINLKVQFYSSTGQKSVYQ